MYASPLSLLPSTAISVSSGLGWPLVTPSLRQLRFKRNRVSARMHSTVSCSSSSSSMPTRASGVCSQLTNDSLKYSRSFWVTKTLIAWNPEDSGAHSFFLYSSSAATLVICDEGISGFDQKIELQEHSSGLPEHVIQNFPHIRGYKAFQVPEITDVKTLLKNQLVIVQFGSDGICIDATGLQLSGVLDDLFSYDGLLGANYSEDGISLHLWAPTAQVVRAWIYPCANSKEPSEIVPLHEVNGTWSIDGPRKWDGCYYVYEVHVYHPSTLAVEQCFANDPYARGLSSDCRRTLFVNPVEDSWKPAQWDSLAERKPKLQSFSDISIYELHIRDFSAHDQTVQPGFRGGYLAFTLEDSAGMLHLRKLSKAGITHLHLLPTFQFAGVDDVKENWKHVDEKLLESFPPDSTEQQAYIVGVQDVDAYNWGYNPVLWGVPKGSYATDANGPHRILEFRKMIQALNESGFRVVLDVVYNHLHASGPHDDSSVLDKIVPGYYLRRNIDGMIENSTCVNNTASEHYMVQRLIIDDLLNWAINFKVDGFRFDLMGHLMKNTMVKARDALRSLTIETDGVNGSDLYLYGEGWDFGEVAFNGRGVNASQFNISGTGIGSFNDRIRDAMLGGSPFGHPLQQGFVTGLMLQPNGHDNGGEENEISMLKAAMDHIQVGMAGNLKDFVFTNSQGNSVKGQDILTHSGGSVAYASHPYETINYVSAHDNETLFDIVSLKTSMELSVDARCRINHLATSIIGLSQGIPFFHAGDEILRSKSLDRDSYNSGDWFNRLDFTYRSNNWGVGLPPEEKNKANWPLIKPRLADPSFKPRPHHIISTVQNFLDVLKMRYSSPLFRLTTSETIQERVRFHNTGPSCLHGVIVMSIEDGHKCHPGLSQLDPKFSYIVVIFNCSPSKVSFVIPSLPSLPFELHPIQRISTDEVVKISSYDSVSGCFVVPPLTTSVFVSPRNTL